MAGREENYIGKEAGTYKATISIAFVVAVTKSLIHVLSWCTHLSSLQTKCNKDET